MVNIFGKLVISALLVLPLNSYATVIFVNNTGVPVTDFHFTADPTRGVYSYTPPVSDPWGVGVANKDGDSYYVSYSGKPIAPLGKLTFPKLTFAWAFGDSAIAKDFTWTPGGQAATPSVPSVPSVPEPESYVFFLVGFSLISLAVRNRKAN